jgi:hypothetical protein
MKMSKQSSIEWLEEQYYELEGKLTRHEFEQAKAMHKEEVKNAFVIRPYTNFEKYYNETYNNENTDTTT